MNKTLDLDNPPTCKCGETAVAADAGVLTSIPYWYCRECKDEVYLSDPIPLFDYDDMEELLENQLWLT